MAQLAYWENGLRQITNSQKGQGNTEKETQARRFLYENCHSLYDLHG